EVAGASCLSVLTDEKFFQGSLDHLRQIREAVKLPLLCKDFILDEREILEAVEWGTGAVLLIVGIIFGVQMERFHSGAVDAGAAGPFRREGDSRGRIADAKRKYSGESERTVGKRMSVKVKICGVTNLEDALAAVDAGADALGFMFYSPSPRNVSIRVAADIIRRLPPFIAKVGVFV